MGLVSKLKNILFEEEEVEIPVIEKKEKKPEIVREYREMPKKEEVKVTNYQDYNALEPVIQQEKKMEEKVRVEQNDTVSERELFKSEKTFNFPAFDEEEFEHYVPRKRPTNVLEHERKQEKKAEYQPSYRKDYKRVEKTEEVKEVKKFRPSPIISPVYGILDKNYTPDEITTRSEVTPTRSLDVDSVRKKAFGHKEDDEKITVDLKDEEVLIDKTLEEKLEKARTIDELLKDSSDEVIDIHEDIDEETFESFPSIDHLDEVEELPNKEESKKEDDLEDDTLENDLFDLIDSMYENREEDK